MRTLEHRRHSRRDPGGVHLNESGRTLARRVGSHLARFDRVVTSPKPRARETAEAMGRAVDAEVVALGDMPDGVGISLDELCPRTFRDYVDLVGRSEAMAGYARDQVGCWRGELERVPEGGSLLMISHGGVIELGVAGAVPETARGWGVVLGYLEGVRLMWDGRGWTAGGVLRIPP